MTFSLLPIAQFFLLLLFFFAYCAASPQKPQQLLPTDESTAYECQLKDVEKGGEEGEVCYRSKEKLADGTCYYQFIGEKIAEEPDSKIYKASKFMQGIQLSESDIGNALAVKVVSTGVFNRTIHLAKPTVMIKHEMKMLKLMNQYEYGKPIEEHSVVKLYGGGEVENGSAFAMIYIMEFGESTLDKYLEQWDKKIKAKKGKKSEKDKQAYEKEKQAIEDEVKREAQELLKKLAVTLLKFHEKAVHLHLKPGNWIFVKSENKWKLIDLQSAVPTWALADLSAGPDQQQLNNQHSDQCAGVDQKLNKKFPESWPKDFMEFACNSLWNVVPVVTTLISRPNERPNTYASPEHKSACVETESSLVTIKNAPIEKMKEQLIRIGPKCDVWSFGVLTLEILAHTPQINPIEKREDPIVLFVKLLDEFKNKIGLIKTVEEFFNVGKKQENVKFDGEEYDIKKGVYMARIKEHFPTEFGLLLKIFVKEPENRVEIADVVRMLKGKMAKYRQFQKKGTKTEEKEEEGKNVKEEGSKKKEKKTETPKDNEKLEKKVKGVKEGKEIGNYQRK
ncbi:hypothetical protein niasHT_008541 [Heterodera trifolii]|uniref:Protein kinase domain-containing protein n=1 Tax=Heterodera trifolii TaxID=157864 RepID=A0ABD2MA09_9BILA